MNSIEKTIMMAGLTAGLMSSLIMTASAVELSSDAKDCVDGEKIKLEAVVSDYRQKEDQSLLRRLGVTSVDEYSTKVFHVPAEKGSGEVSACSQFGITVKFEVVVKIKLDRRLTPGRTVDVRGFAQRNLYDGNPMALFSGALREARRNMAMAANVAPKINRQPKFGF